MAKYQVETDGGVFEVQVQEDQPTQRESPLMTGAKTAGRMLAGPGISQFIPGLEDPSVQAGAKWAQNVGESVTENFPSRPNLSTPLGNINPKTVSRELISGALDPRSIASMAAGPLSSGAGRLATRAASGLEEAAASKIGKAQDLAMKVLKPKNLDVSVNRGDLPSSITEGTKAIKKVKDYSQLRDVFDTAKKKPMVERQRIYDTTKASTEPSQLDPAFKLLDEKVGNKRTKPGEIRKTEQTLEREMDALASETSEQLSDPNYLQAQKEFYQMKADPLFKKKEMGTITGNESAELQTYDKLAKGYQSKLESLDPSIRGLNREFQGLNEAQELASEHAAKQMVTDVPSIVERVVSNIPFINRWMPLSGAKNVAMEIAQRGSSLPSRTGKIESLVKLSKRDRALANLLRGKK